MHPAGDPADERANGLHPAFPSWRQLLKSYLLRRWPVARLGSFSSPVRAAGWGDGGITGGHHAEKAGTPPLEQAHAAGGGDEQEGSGQEDDRQDGHPPRSPGDRADNA
ncbi:hypothetical protein GCM10010412_021030 [Nonomuraea recticatena]|uniref:Uncharacterized protein n=1 Tax=Nonomuraea recticatena TaxID=46178 RepID=A0ABP6DZM7_9ACTN